MALFQKESVGELSRGCKMPPGKTWLSSSLLTPDGPFPLGPFPRHIWIHNNTPKDSLDKVCHEIWQRVQRLAEELQPPQQHHSLCPHLAGTIPADPTSSQYSNYLLDESQGLESLYKAVIGNKEREMKLQALCDAQVAAKSATTGFLGSAKSHKNSEGLEDSSKPSVHSKEGSKHEGSLQKHTSPSKASSDEGKAEKPEVVMGSTHSSTMSHTAAPVEASSAGPEQQQSPPAKSCSQVDLHAAAKDPVTTPSRDKKPLKHNTSASGFSASSAAPSLHTPAWQGLSYLQYPVFPNQLSFPQGQGPYQPRVRFLYQQAPRPSYECYSRQVVPYGPQQIYHPPYSVTMNYITLVQTPGYPLQQVTPPALPSNRQDLLPMAGNSSRFPFAPPYGFNSRPGGAVMTTLNHRCSESSVKF